MLTLRRLSASCLLLAACTGGDAQGTDASESSSTGAGTGTGTGTGTTEGTPTSTSTSDDSTGPTTGAPADGVPGCDGATLLPVPEDTSLPGPWPVGARTVTVGGLTVEVWYPAVVGSEVGAEVVRYDIRASLPDSEKAKVPDEATPWQDCDCWRDLPIDAAHGPYPAVVFVHGTAGFRSQSLELVTHWASRGFVVLAADHPGLYLKDLLGQLCGVTSPPQKLAADIDALVAGIQAPTGELEFLAGRVDGGRIATTGHSAGGGAVADTGDVARLVMPMAAGGVQAGAALESSLVLGAQADKVVKYSAQLDGYAATPGRKRLVGISNAGHLAFSSLCSLRNAADQDFVTIANQYEICGAQVAGALFDCMDSYTPDTTSWEIVQYATSAALEETLHCSQAGTNFAALKSTFPEVGEFLEAL